MTILNPIHQSQTVENFQAGELIPDDIGKQVAFTVGQGTIEGELESLGEVAEMIAVTVAGTKYFLYEEKVVQVLTRPMPQKPAALS